MLLCCVHQECTILSSPKPLWETLGMGEESNPTAKTLPISPTRKISLNKFTSSPINNVISSLSNSNIYVITLYKIHLQLQSFLLYHVFNFSLYVHTCHLQYGKKVVQLTFSPHIFSFQVKSGACYITGHWARFQNKMR